MTTWSLDPAHSAINFSVRHMMFSKVRGRFGSYTTKLELDPANLAATKIEVDIDVATIDSGVADRDAHLRSADFFDAEKFPKMRFVSKKVEAAGKDHYRVSGELTIRDVTKPITLEVEALGGGKDPWGNQRLGFAAQATIEREDWGLKWNQALEAGGVLVGKKVEIEIEAQAVGK